MLGLISLGTKIFSLFIRLFKLGAGYTLPGHFALKLYPRILSDKHIIFKKGLILITGTNGKTTTSLLVSSVLKNKGYSIVSNSSGANLLNGVVSAILLAYKGKAFDYGVFEVDEAALLNVLEFVLPTHILFLNLSRDQLDRHWEPDLLLEKWQKALMKLPQLPRIVYFSEQPEFKGIAFSNSLSFSSRNPVVVSGSEVLFNGKNIGTTKLTGYFNECNLNAALIILQNLGVEIKDALEAMNFVEFAFGRGEKIHINDKEVLFYLAKNPASFNSNLDYVKGLSGVDSLIFILNDNIPDGRDVSWIYDIIPEKLRTVCADKKIVVTGKRCFDMAVRLKYASVEITNEQIYEDLKTALSAVLKDAESKKIVVLPNYSAMLESRKILIGRKIL